MDALSDLDGVLSLLEWDRATAMPPRGSSSRGRQIAAIRAVAHARLADAAWNDVLGEAASELGATYAGLHVPVMARTDAGQAAREGERIAVASIERTRRAVREAVAVPGDLVVAISHATTRAHEAWLGAREGGPESTFLAALADVVRLKQEEADALGWTERRYDALHDTFEPGSTTAAVASACAVVAEAAKSALERVRASQVQVDATVLRRRVPIADQERFVRALVADLGYAFDGGVLATTVHPFCQSIAHGDVRIATRYQEDNLGTALFGTVHEAGHGLYEQGIHEAGLPSPVASFASLAVHESQSRLYENHVARSHAFWQARRSHLVRACPGTFDDVGVDAIHAAVGVVAATPIRVEADEVTYPLHVVMRTELEMAMIDGALDVADLPQAWDEASRTWLGITPGDAVEGYLQDIHWAMGAFGYFPTYVLGSMAAAQMWERLTDDLGGVDDDLAAGSYDRILAWLREHVHHLGAIRMPHALLAEATGRPLGPDALVRHLHARVDAVYGR